jgi:hypothetical protein
MTFFKVSFICGNFLFGQRQWPFIVLIWGANPPLPTALLNEGLFLKFPAPVNRFKREHKF